MTRQASALDTKLGLKKDARAYISGAPGEVVDALSAVPAELASALSGEFDFMLAFFKSADDLDARFPRLRNHLAVGGALWVAWPKGGGLGTDLSLPKIIEIGYGHDMVESKTIGVDAIWSAIKFTAPKPGKTYRNSYGRLASQQS